MLPEKVEECGTDQKALFCVMNEILGCQKELALPPHISLKDKLDKFIIFFKTKITNIRLNLDPDLDEASHDLPSVLPANDPTPGGTLTAFRRVTAEEI